MKPRKISVKFYFNTRTNDDGKNHLGIRVREGRDYTRVYYLNICCFKALWDDKKQMVKASHPQADIILSLIHI